ncbi:hypothetical protein SBRCBS47491_009375 [Sporothrix bragantina]|uniref:Secreted protein n=1 Tax=Sporothrix bragantina TaxID=671064 RepID=A0ABP0CU72_9PEZI
MGAILVFAGGVQEQVLIIDVLIRPVTLLVKPFLQAKRFLLSLELSGILVKILPTLCEPINDALLLDALTRQIFVLMILALETLSLDTALLLKLQPPLANCVLEYTLSDLLCRTEVSEILTGLFEFLRLVVEQDRIVPLNLSEPSVIGGWSF